MCPEAKIDDGLLDITYVQNVAPEKVPELLQVVALGGKEEDDLKESIRTMRVPWFEVLRASCALSHDACGTVGMEYQCGLWCSRCQGLDTSNSPSATCCVHEFML